MSVQPPPTNTTTPLFNPTFYINPVADGSITIGFLDQNYLKFPVAQGSEEFVDGLFSVDAIDFNSAIGGDRAITGISTQSFTDIFDNASYTASIEENSTAIGIYDGGLIIESTNTIDLRATNVLINSAPLAGGNVNTNTNNTFVNGFTNNFQGNVSFTNGGQILMNTSIAVIDFPSTFPTGTSGSATGLGIYWNQSNGGGETDFICYGQGASGGLDIYGSGDTTATTMIAQLRVGDINFSYTPTQPALAPYPISGNDNGSATIGYVNDALTSYAPLASPTLTGVPLSTTATAGDNTTQIATTAFVQSAVSGAGGSYVLLNGTNNITGANTFTQSPNIPNPTYPNGNGSSTLASSIGYVNQALTKVYNYQSFIYSNSLTNTFPVPILTGGNVATKYVNFTNGVNNLIATQITIEFQYGFLVANGGIIRPMNYTNGGNTYYVNSYTLSFNLLNPSGSASGYQIQNDNSPTTPSIIFGSGLSLINVVGNGHYSATYTEFGSTYSPFTIDIDTSTGVSRMRIVIAYPNNTNVYPTDNNALVQTFASIKLVGNSTGGYGYNNSGNISNLYPNSTPLSAGNGMFQSPIYLS